MKRRHFINSSLLSGLGLANLASLPKLPKKPVRQGATGLLTAYYFRAHTYTMVPKQIEEDMARMADAGTNNVAVAVLEQDLWAAVENIAFIREAAHRRGMKLYAVPSRWGGMFAGAPKVPSLFSVKNPQTWILKKDGTPHVSNVSGVISSVHYPETYTFFTESIEKMMNLWEVDGIIWDEPKSYRPDYSPKAIEKLGEGASNSAHIQAVVDFHGRLNAFIKEKWPKVSTHLFAYANMPDKTLEIVAKTPQLDYFGCDGRPWHQDDGGVQESSGKTLLGNGERYLKAARDNNVKSLWLIENHNMEAQDIELARKRLPEVVSKTVDHLIYYYFPRNLANPEENMQLIFKEVAKFE